MPIAEHTCYRVTCDGDGCNRIAYGAYDWYESIAEATSAAWVADWTEVIGDDGDHRWYCPECYAQEPEEETPCQ
jgi:hypothetical protein